MPIIDGIAWFAVRAFALIQGGRNGAANIADVAALGLSLVDHALSRDRESGNQESGFKNQQSENWDAAISQEHLAPDFLTPDA
ncbi:MAG: hypothetical protein JO134_14000 [Xanthobacteraceae bacterium]|nr:hypothetical protein [Xanthobacteraceae bacterium]